MLYHTLYMKHSIFLGELCALPSTGNTDPRLRYRTKRGFTLIELLVVIAIITLLTAITFAALSTAKAKVRDARRLADLYTIYKAISVYETTTTNPNYGAVNTVYVSLPDTSATCNNLELPALQPGWSYRCVLASALKNTNGTGWLPIDFAGTSNDAFIKTLPLDPINSVDGYYSYIAPQGNQMHVIGASTIEEPTPTMDINSTGGLTVGAFASFAAATGATSSMSTIGGGGGGQVGYAFNPYPRVDYGVNLGPRSVVNVFKHRDRYL
jgi:prepilin-type N-terminal cleavage/methylation domain-containing protein